MPIIEAPPRSREISMESAKTESSRDFIGRSERACACRKWHEHCYIAPQAPPTGRGCEKTGGPAAHRGAGNGHWQDFTTAFVARRRGAHPGLCVGCAPRGGG